MEKKRKNNIPLPIFILVCACLLYAMYSSLSTIALGLWGESVMGTVDSYDARLDDTDAGENRSRTISKGYYFSVNGKEYRGYVMYASDEAWPRLQEGETRSERISYFSFFPYINKPSELTDFSQMGEVAIIYHIVSPIGCIFLLLLVTGTLKRKKKRKNSAKKIAEPQNNYIEGDKDMFCYNCGNGLPEGASFCSGCGTRTQQNNANICSVCGAVIPQGAGFCINCGTKTQASDPNICLACGAAIPDDADFCINCGAARGGRPDAGTARTPSVTGSSMPAQPVYPAPAQSNAGQSTGLIGFSAVFNSPEILEAAKKNKKSSIGCLFIMVFVPLIGFPIAGLLMDDVPFGEAVVIGVGISLVMLIVNLFALGRTRKPIWEGTVVNKYSKERSEHRGGEDDNYRTYMEYTTMITTDEGKRKRIVERDSQRDMYDYLSVGDRVRYHPKFGTYEKYDKSKDRIIYCNVCRMMNPIQNDRCKRCNNLLFK